jgi:membrane protein DedA with SNARE-associated domain
VTTLLPEHGLVLLFGVNVTKLLMEYGLFLLFGLVAIESAGIPLPGETALIAAALLSQSGDLHHSIEVVIAVAAAGAIVGDNVGYWLGREGGRALLEKTPIIRDHFERVLPRAEEFFRRHGPKAVFIGRFIAILRVTAAWLAGISRMPWWRFVIWNAAGGIAWAALVGIVAYEAGRAAADAIGRYGLYAAIVIAVAAVVGFFGFRLWRRRVADSG